MLAGLSSAPQYVVEKCMSLGKKSMIVGSDVDSVILPIDACGGDAALAFASRNSSSRVCLVVILVFMLICNCRLQTADCSSCWLMFCLLFQPLLVAVEENETVLSDTPDKLGIPVVRLRLLFFDSVQLQLQTT